MRPLRSPCWPLAVALTLPACSGWDGIANRDEPPRAAADDAAAGPPAPPASGGPPLPCEPAAPRRLRRLSHAEYATVVSDLFGARVDLLAGFPPDTTAEGFVADAEALTVTGTLVDAYARAAEEAARRLPIARLAPCPASATAEGHTRCARAFIESLGRRAFGRPLAAEESARLQAVYAAGAEGGAHEDGVRLAAEAILQSPHFIYRTELGAGGPAPHQGLVRLEPYELASALSFLTTGSRPDDALLAAAGAGTLAAASGLEAEARRLLATPRARAHLRDFLRAWLEVDEVDRLAKALDVVELPSALRAEMDAEVRRFIEAALASGGRLDDLFAASTSVVGPLLRSRIYVQPGELLDPPRGETEAVRLDPTRRRGLLSLPGFLATHATPDRTSPVARGLFVLSELLCRSIPEPPPDAVIAPIDPFDNSRTTREKTAAHAQESCRACHDLIDPIGFGFEQMDLVGRLRTEEHGRPIDSSGALTASDVDGPFTGPAQLGERLARSAAVRGCFTAQLYRWAEGRAEAEGCGLEALQRAFAPAGTTIDELVLAYVTSVGFAHRRADQ